VITPSNCPPPINGTQTRLPLFSAELRRSQPPEGHRPIVLGRLEVNGIAMRLQAWKIAAASSFCGCNPAPAAADKEVEPAKTRFSLFSSTSQIVTESTWKISEIKVTAAWQRSACLTRETIPSVSVLQTVR
jgi:hypothetical protein